MFRILRRIKCFVLGCKVCVDVETPFDDSSGERKYDDTLLYVRCKRCERRVLVDRQSIGAFLALPFLSNDEKVDALVHLSWRQLCDFRASILRGKYSNARVQEFLDTQAKGALAVAEFVAQAESETNGKK